MHLQITFIIRFDDKIFSINDLYQPPEVPLKKSTTLIMIYRESLALKTFWGVIEKKYRDFFSLNQLVPIYGMFSDR